MSPWQFESVLDVPKDLALKFPQNRVINSWDISDLKVPCGGVKTYFSVQLWPQQYVLVLG